MKSDSVRDAAAQLDRLVAEAARGNVVVLTDGHARVTLTTRRPGLAFDPEEDSAELEAELAVVRGGTTCDCGSGDR